MERESNPFPPAFDPGDGVEDPRYSLTPLAAAPTPSFPVPARTSSGVGSDDPLGNATKLTLENSSTAKVKFTVVASMLSVCNHTMVGLV